jgi:hypothetical protein
MTIDDACGDRHLICPLPASCLSHFFVLDLRIIIRQI